MFRDLLKQICTSKSDNAISISWNINDKLIDNIKSVIRDKKYNNDEYAIIKCDLRVYKNISIYRDTMSNGINKMYTVYPISPKCLTVYYNIEDIL